MSYSESRRRFLRSLWSTPLALALGLNKNLFAGPAPRKTVNTTEAAAKAALVDVKRADTPSAKTSDTMAKALKYIYKSVKADQKCENCMHFSQALDAAGKEIHVDIKGNGKQRVGSCALFEAGKGYVSAPGWCMSWFKQPA